MDEPGATPTPTMRDRVRGGDTLLGAFLHGGSPVVAELCGRSGFDWVLVDLEHGAATEAELLPQLLAIAATPATAVVRVEEGTRLRIGRALDLGADGLMIPRLDTVDQVRQVVSWLRYPPTGVRGVAMMTRGAGLGGVTHDAIRDLNERPLLVVQIESASAVNSAHAIADIDGVDVLFVGPSDLSHALGIPGRLDEPVYVEALDTVLAAARSRGKAPGILLRNAAHAPRYLERGFTFVGIGSDLAFVADGAQVALRAAGR
jgi:2-keto-3-deoxy-L-rhamnonate aldolase RhmA